MVKLTAKEKVLLNAFRTKSDFERFSLLAESQVSSEHSIFCICGRLATGLHESLCTQFKTEVVKRTIKLMQEKYGNDY